MTNREKAIVTAYTGISMFKGEKIDEFYKYLKELYGRPIYTHEIPFLDIQEKSKEDFIALCRDDSDGELAKRLNDLIFDINPAEICAQIEADNLKKWCKTIQIEMKMAMVQLSCWEDDSNG